jgi:hypothetical protein
MVLPPVLPTGAGVAADSNRPYEDSQEKNVMKEICATSEQKIMITIQNRSTAKPPARQVA